MRWLTFFILAYVSALLQTTLLGAMLAAVVGGATINLLLAVALFYALWAGRGEALWVCWILGLVADLASTYRFGVYAVTFALAGLGVVRIRAQLFREHPLCVLSLAFVLTFGTEAVAGGLTLLLIRSAAEPWGRLLLTSLLTAVFTGLACVPLHWLLRRSRRLTGTPAALTT